MRWIFFSLVLANVALYIWHSLESDRQARFEKLNAASASPSERAVQGRPLVLVRELTEEEKIEIAKRPREAMVPAAAPVPAPEPAAPTAPVAAPEVVTAAASSDTAATPAPPASNPAPNVVTNVVPNQCLMFGPLTDKQYDQIAQRLLARSIVPERRLVDVKSGTEYWVVLPPLDSEQAAVMKLQEIQGRGIQGGQIIPKGELANAIAFGGVFAQKGEAEKTAEKMHAKGVKAEVRSLPRTQQQKWVSLSERQTPKLSDELWKEIEQDFPHFKKETYFCH